MRQRCGWSVCVLFEEELHIRFQLALHINNIQRGEDRCLFGGRRFVKHTKILERRKIRMIPDRKNTQPTSYINNTGKASVFTSFKGSVTVEAAMAVPIFFFAILCLIYLFEIMAIQTAIHSGMQYAGKIAMQESYPLSVIIPGSIEEDIVTAIGAKRLDQSIVVGGSAGIDCSSSYMSPRTGIGKIVAEYKVSIPVPVFSIREIKQTESIRIKAWTGYEKEVFGQLGEETVYITETGLVYHQDYHCTYLDLSIHMVNTSEIGGLRNSDGGKYYACRLCHGGESNHVYITDDGSKYHGSLSCSGLKRTVYAVPLSEVIGKGGCVRCVK